jgi:hypothetical protein
MMNAVFCDKKYQFILHSRHVTPPLHCPVSACKIWGFNCGTYEECLFLGCKTLFLPQRRHITSPLHSSASQLYESFEVFTAMTEEYCLLRMWHRVTLVRVDVSEENNTSVIRVKMIGKRGTALALTSKRITLQGAAWSSETTVLVRALRLHIQ